MQCFRSIPLEPIAGPQYLNLNSAPLTLRQEFLFGVRHFRVLFRLGDTVVSSPTPPHFSLLKHIIIR